MGNVSNSLVVTHGEIFKSQQSVINLLYSTLLASDRKLGEDLRTKLVQEYTSTVHSIS